MLLLEDLLRSPVFECSHFHEENKRAVDHRNASFKKFVQNDADQKKTEKFIRLQQILIKA